MNKWIRSLNQKVCPWWLMPTLENPMRRFIQRPEVILAGLVSAGDRALDLGCGMGYFTIPLARMVGEAGLVTAVDVQEKMLKGLEERAMQRGLLARIELVNATHAKLQLETPYDFCLAFWMLHEVRDQTSLLRVVYEALRPGCVMLLVEPKIHVSKADFKSSLNMAEEVGFTLHQTRMVWGSRSEVCRRDI